jgi:hypothetical protein
MTYPSGKLFDIHVIVDDNDKGIRKVLHFGDTHVCVRNEPIPHGFENFVGGFPIKILPGIKVVQDINIQISHHAHRDIDRTDFVCGKVEGHSSNSGGPRTRRQLPDGNGEKELVLGYLGSTGEEIKEKLHVGVGLITELFRILGEVERENDVLSHLDAGRRWTGFGKAGCWEFDLLLNQTSALREESSRENVRIRERGPLSRQTTPR